MRSSVGVALDTRHLPPTQDICTNFRICDAHISAVGLCPIVIQKNSRVQDWLPHKLLFTPCHRCGLEAFLVNGLNTSGPHCQTVHHCALCAYRLVTMGCYPPFHFEFTTDHHTE